MECHWNRRTSRPSTKMKNWKEMMRIIQTSIPVVKSHRQREQKWQAIATSYFMNRVMMQISYKKQLSTTNHSMQDGLHTSLETAHLCRPLIQKEYPEEASYSSYHDKFILSCAESSSAFSSVLPQETYQFTRPIAAELLRSCCGYGSCDDARFCFFFFLSYFHIACQKCLSKLQHLQSLNFNRYP